MYDSLNSACKSFVSITGGNHCQFAGFNLNCSFGQSTCSPQASISEADQQNLVFTFLLPWLNFYLKNDCNAGPLFQNLISAGNGITSQQNCSLACLPAGNAEHFANNLLSFPNPSSDRLFFKTTNKAAGKICFLTDASGRTILQQKVETENNVLNLEKLSDGIYFLHLPEQPTQKIILQR
jgi:hypothetical protein